MKCMKCGRERYLSETHLALVKGEVAGREDVLVRMHAHCLYGDVFGANTCDCQRVVRSALERICFRSPWSRSLSMVFSPAATAWRS